MRDVYFDNNATTPIHPEVVDAMLPFLRGNFGNPSSLHKFGRKIRVKIDEAREKVAHVIGADVSEVVFTSGGSESDNFAIKGAVWARRDNGNHIITSAVEHHAVLNTCRYLEKNGYSVTYMPVDQYGMVNAEDVKKAIKNNTVLITIHHANNEIGTIQPISEISEIARERGVLFHTDAVQSLGKIPMNMSELGVDLLSVSAHKVYGPKGIGALYIRKGKKLHPLISGGHHEKRRRAGTENVTGIIGFGRACEIIEKDIESENSHLLRLRDKLYTNIKENVPRVRLNGHPEKRLPNTLNMSFECVEGESLMINLDLAGVAVSTGSACSSGSLEPSHVLMAMGIPPEVVHGSLRFSLGRTNTDEDVDYICNVLPPIIEKVRAMSPLWED